MAIARYKVLKDDFGYMLGANLLLTPENAEADLVLGRLQLVEYLNPEDELDAAKIRRFYENPNGTIRPEGEEPSLEEAVKGITGKSVKGAARNPGRAGADDGADGGEANVRTPSATAGEGDAVDYDAQTVPELKELATSRGVDISGLTVKDDLIKALKKADKKG